MSATTKPAAPKKATKTRTPKPATLLSYILTYVETEDIGNDQPVAKLIDRLKESIVAEALDNLN